MITDLHLLKLMEGLAGILSALTVGYRSVLQLELAQISLNIVLSNIGLFLRVRGIFMPMVFTRVYLLIQ